LAILLLAIATFFTGKPSKELPRNWDEFVFEFMFVWAGVLSVLEGIFRKSQNKVGEFDLQHDEQLGTKDSFRFVPTI